MWSLVYLRLPANLVVGPGTAYTSKEMRRFVEAHGIKLQKAPIETPGGIATVERHYAPLQVTHERIRADAGNHTSDQK